jgi:hypothetical protein
MIGTDRSFVLGRQDRRADDEAERIGQDPPMDAPVARRTTTASTVQETMDRAHAGFYPTLRQAPGLKSLSLIRGDEGIVPSVIVFENRADFDAFQGVFSGWVQTLDDLGHAGESMSAGEVIQHVTLGA